MINRICFYILLALFSGNLMGTTLMSWDFAGNAGNETTVTASVFAANVSNTAPSGVISRGAGINAATNADRFNANSWTTTNNNLADAITNNKYMQFVIAPGPSYAMSITSLHMWMQRSSTGPLAFAIRSSSDSYTTDLGTFSVSSGTTSFEQTVNITSLNNQISTITFRIYGYSASGGTGSFGFEGTGADLEIIGSVAANYTVPTVTMGSISTITHYGCLAGGNVTSDGGSPITGRGVVVSASSNPMIGGGGVLQFADASAATGSFSETVTGLLANTLYYVNAYATNNAGTSYGTETTFTTATFPAPILLPASNITNISFRANWQPVVNAQNYRLDVATQPVFTTGGSSTLINEGFAGGLTPPTGWTFNGITQTYTGSGYYGAAAPALKFDSNNDYVETSTITNPYSISFWVRSSGTMTNAFFTVTEFYSAAWHTVATLTPGGTSPYDLPATGTTKTFSLNSLTTKVRFTFTRDAGLAGLDDVLIIGNYTSNTYVPGYNDLVVSSNYQNVTGLTPNNEYFYRVRAYSTSGTLSPNSSTDSVTVVYSGSINPPSNLAAAATSASSIDLTWQQNGSGDNVMVAYSSNGVFGVPSGSYALGAAISGGGTVIFNGNGTNYGHNGLTPSTTYYYRAWSVDVENHYSSAINANATTQSGTSERIKVTYIDVKQGDCILIQRGTHNYLIDAGKQLTDRKLLQYLRQVGVTHLDAAMISHPDYDHYAEYVTLLDSNQVVVDQFIKNSDTSTAITWSTLMGLISTRGIPIQVVDANSNLNWVLETDILNPPPGASGTDNNDSIVMKMVYGNVSFLFTGDMEVATNTYITSNYDVNVDILKVSHHGSINGTTESFLAEATPAISVISVGNNSFGHPSYTVIGLLQNSGSQIYATADDWNTWTGNGSSDDTDDDDIILETDGTNVWINNNLVWTVPTTSIDAPVNVSINITGSQLSLTWNNVPTATSYRVYSNTISPYSSYTEVTAGGSFSTNGSTTTWTLSGSPADLMRYFYIKAVK